MSPFICNFAHVMKKVYLTLAALAVLSTHAATNDSIDGRYYRLFAPVTFYHDVAQEQLALTANRQKDDIDNAIERALVHVYLNRPDLVKVTETEQQASGTLRQDIIEKPVAEVADLVDQAEPIPDEPVMETVVVEVQKPNFWKYKGDGSLQFMQNYVSDNWYKGGESNYSAVASLTLEANYDNKSKFKWENKLEMKLGFQTSRADSVHKFKTNEDLLRYTGKVGLQAAKNWYYTLQMLAYTQFAQGFKANDIRTYSDFLSPLTVSIGLGMDYKVSWLVPPG